MTKPAFSIVMRSRNDIGIIGRTLRGVFDQRDVDLELVALDNGSTDGTRELLSRHGARLIDVPEGTYNPGRVLNRGVREARADIVVMLNSDTVPQGRTWLRDLTAPIVRGEADAVYGRQIPRLDATTIVRLDYERAFGDAPPNWQPFFSMAQSAFRREVLLARPFSESVQYSEDLEWAARAQREGLRLAYVPEALAEHSHNYTVREYWKRFFEEGRADAAIFPNGERPLQPLRVAVGWARDVARDMGASLRAGDAQSLAMSPVVRAAQRVGYAVGRYAGPRPNMQA